MATKTTNLPIYLDVPVPNVLQSEVIVSIQVVEDREDVVEETYEWTREGMRSGNLIHHISSRSTCLFSLLSSCYRE